MERERVSEREKKKEVGREWERDELIAGEEGGEIVRDIDSDTVRETGRERGDWHSIE